MKASPALKRFGDLRPTIEPDATVSFLLVDDPYIWDVMGACTPGERGLLRLPSGGLGIISNVSMRSIPKAFGAIMTNLQGRIFSVLHPVTSTQTIISNIPKPPSSLGWWYPSSFRRQIDFRYRPDKRRPGCAASFRGHTVVALLQSRVRRRKR